MHSITSLIHYRFKIVKGNHVIITKIKDMKYLTIVRLRLKDYDVTINQSIL